MTHQNQRSKNQRGCMMFYFDALERAIWRHLEPDINKALKSCDVISMQGPMDYAMVPLQADVKVAYEKGFARFQVHGRCFHYGREKYLNVESYFDSKPITSHADAAAYIEYVFEQAKRRILAQLADDAFIEMMKAKETP